MKKRIMYITQSNGGVAKYLEMLFKYMDRSNYEQILVYLTEYDYEKYKFDNIVDNIEFVDMCREINPIKDVKSIMKINKLIKKYNPDIIYVHSSKGGALGRIANIITRKPIIYNAHGWAFNMEVSKLKKLVYRIIEKELAKITDYIITISDQERKSALVNKICKEEKLKVIFNGIDIEKYDRWKMNSCDFREKYGIPKDAIVFGMVGRISKQKAPDIFIKSAAKIKEQIQNSFFIIVGDGEDRKSIDKMVENLGLNESVLITGWVDNTFEYISTFDIAMLLSRWEGFGLAIAEYMVSNKPIIATNVDAIPNLIENNVSGLLISKDSIDECVESAIKLITNEELNKRITLNADKKVRNMFNIRRVSCDHKKLFNYILNSDRKKDIDNKIIREEVSY